ncbi:prenylcysteine alpha-carboxyl methylesterase [Fistulifera solaris]|uniref:Prenylcysteine alpha-carboxyl methylesterase n=1 Tax=Fistulifera solaris TaxID=1519565 RepID=A0A1Z5JJK0_FISSO|nr:prenylcysteine alpha-carboxyl methylesterase [Fistulifera solaris]|eukprot:GAX14190.1 prenylcysteine alpha-carboxyl methylesterase [Fistulifera solaris]
MKVFSFHSEHPEQPLLTEKSFSLALSPPRAPPLGTAHRSLLASADDENLSKKPFVLSASKQQEDVRTIQALARLQQHLFDQHTFLRKEDRRRRRRRLPHPHLTLVAAPGDRWTRYLSTVLPLRLQNYTRDSGLFRWIVDHLVQASAPLMALTAPSSALRDFLSLTSIMQKHAYGSHPMQYIELYLPSERPVRNLVYFVHGGAWGSGVPWFYRLLAAPFVCRRDTAVAVIGYRTYPSSRTVDEQVEDCQRAANYLLQEYPELCQGIITVMGHSSGAHVALLMLVEQANKRMRQRKFTEREDAAVASFNVTNFVGLSGPYDISHHFDYEAARGVEELSPMKPVCGYSREAFRRNSPHLRLQHALVDGGNESLIGQCMPPHMALVHGIEDDTVPFTATGEAARVLRSCGITSCDELYVAKTGHQDVVVQMMVGGPTQDMVMSWMREKEDASIAGMSTKFAPTLFVPSKL